MDLELAGKRALVTGGSRGLGFAIAHALLQEGVRVAVAARDVDSITAAAAALAGGTGGEAHGLTVDTREDASVDALVTDAADRLGGLDIVVNAAARPGAAPTAPGIAHLTSEFMLEEFDTKLVGYLRVCRAAAPILVANGWGRIINIGGLAARQSVNTTGTIRSIAVAALTKNLADELGPRGVNVTVVHPGPTRTEGTIEFLAAMAEARGIHVDEAERQFASGSLLGRLVQPKEVADVVAFLASPRSAAINGDAIAAGGGTPRTIAY